MRIAEVIATVTLSRMHDSLHGKRWLVAVPFSLSALETKKPDGEDIVLVDELGVGFGQWIGVSEGVEAQMPFYPNKKPLDAYNAVILDRVTVEKSK